MFIDTALKNMAKDPIWYKQVAGELRVLVANHKPANRQIQTLMYAIGVGMDVHVPATQPFIDRCAANEPARPTEARHSWVPLSNGGTILRAVGNKWEVVRNRKNIEPWDGSIPFKDYCEIGLACVVDGRPTPAFRRQATLYG